MKTSICLSVLFFVLMTETNSSKILFLLPIASKSHHNVFEPLVRALAAKGHDILLLSPVQASGMPKNVESLSFMSVEDIFGTMPNVFEMRKGGKMAALFGTSLEYLETACHKTFQNEQFQDIIKNQEFDLVFIDIYLNWCLAGALQLLKAPYIYVVTMPGTNHITEPMGTHLPPSFVPSSFFEYSDRMNFGERFQNTVLQWVINIASNLFFIPKFENIYRQYLGEDLPAHIDFNRNASMLFMNSHFSMTYSRPLLPDIIEVGAMHCRPGQPLPKDLDDFINGAKDGVLFFSLGSIAKATDMPNETRQIFLNVFSRLKQRVIWKWETETMEDVPSNVMLKKYLPQQDILAHKNTRIFMTHGGLLSFQEAVYHGVPLIGIPLFADQDLNVKKAESAGFSVTLEILDLTEEILEATINRVLNDQSFAQRVKEKSAIMKDDLQTPIERAVYWSEYIIRHKGAKHLRSPARDLNAIQYHSVDVIIFLFAIIFSVLWVAKLIIVKIYRLCCKSKKMNNSKSLIRSKKSD